MRQQDMRLQLAIDAPEHLALIGVLAPYVDIVEVGTPVLKRFGLSAITTAAELSGGLPVLADTKTADGGALEARMVFAAGASFMTVLAQAAPATREATRSIAAEHGGAVVFDTILDGGFDAGVLLEEAELREETPGDVWLALHSSSDARLAGHTGEEHIARVADRRAAGFRISLAGGIGRTNLDRVLAVAPDVIVVGSGLTGAANPAEEASWIRERIARVRG